MSDIIDDGDYNCPKCKFKGSMTELFHHKCSVHDEIIRLHDCPVAKRVIACLLEDLDKTDVHELVLVWTKTGKSGAKEFNRYWFGTDSTLFVIGLLSNFLHHVNKYNEDDSDEGDE